MKRPAFTIGLLIAVIVILSVVIGIGLELFGYGAAAWTMGFIAIVSMISYWKSFDGKWSKK